MNPELTKALCNFYKDVAVIRKDAKAQYGRFADLSTVLTAVTPALAKNGLACPQTFEPSADGGQTILITTLSHTSGECIQSRLPMMINSGRNVLHDFGGSVTYLRRYALLAILGLAADVDTDGDFDPPSSATKPEPKAKPAKKQEAPKPEPAPEAAPEPTDKPVDLPLSADDRSLLIQCLKELSSDQLSDVLTAFKAEFGLAPDAKLKTEMTTEKHATFLRAKLASLS